ncbi:class II glutamine amidotransferase [Sedimentitalea sp. XS_ASV28]|uniref:class II glutamine amidotransferase n=1 Tax=Sedimentitalea sp. XS_ASV28 TaxID=3241296 RepID=UPI0035187B8D
MCELFAMSASRPTDVNQSLALLQPRGGEIGPHADGWGVAFYEGRAARIFKEPVPAAESRCLAFITEYDFRSTNVIAHIRKANPEKIGRASANTHPFERELDGRSWVFAHNGKLPGVSTAPPLSSGRFQPLGDTDSEHAFCLLLNRIAESGPGLSAGELLTTITPLISDLASLGEFNFMLSDGEHLIAHAHTHLHKLRRNCCGGDAAQEIVLFATKPLTDEPWQPLEPGSVHVFAEGKEVHPNGSIPASHAA